MEGIAPASPVAMGDGAGCASSPTVEVGLAWRSSTRSALTFGASRGIARVSGEGHWQRDGEELLLNAGPEWRDQLPGNRQTRERETV